MSELLRNLLGLCLDAAPWLLLGLLAAGLLKAWVPEQALSRWLGGGGFWPVAKASLLGAPLPLCSCSVLPAALGLRRAGASDGATVSFLIATPETGPDSIGVSYALLGPAMAVVRPLAAVLSAVLTGLLTNLAPVRPSRGPVTMTSSGGCCQCACATSVPAAQRSLGRRTAGGLRYALADIYDDIAPWLGFGLLVAAAVMTWVPPLAIAQWGSGLPAMLLMLLVGMPMYICATASTPFAAALLLAGVSPGTALVFLLAGPATNMATMGVIRSEMGGRVLAVYLLGIAVASVALGLLTDAWFQALALQPAAQVAEHTESLPSWLSYGSAAVLALLALRRPLRRVLPPRTLTA